MANGGSREQGRVGLGMTIEQRRVVLEGIRREWAGVGEDIEATAATLGVVGSGNEPREAGLAERATLQLLWDEQLRQQGELTRLFGECDSLMVPGRLVTTEGEGLPAAA